MGRGGGIVCRGGLLRFAVSKNPSCDEIAADIVYRYLLKNKYPPKK